MTQKNDFKVYVSEGKPLSQRQMSLPFFDKNSISDSPDKYIADEPLANAVNVAINLGQPLLVTGEPGTGKTQLAYSIAYQLDQIDLLEHLVFYTKNNSNAKDLFYHYDALRHFHDTRIRNTELDVRDYIRYEALGLAILLTKSPADEQRKQINKYLPEELQGVGPVRPVVLIDEIDKAPRDLPNDILSEIEKMSFTVRETGQTFKAEDDYKPILVLTSNSEKDLPDAFLRRCIFYHIPFPEFSRLKEIVSRRLPLSEHYKVNFLDGAIEHFEAIREMALRKKPATAELIEWVRILESKKLDVMDPKPGALETMAFTYSILAKNKEDLELLNKIFVEKKKSNE